MWLRKWRILVTDAKDEVALDISDLRITFEVRYAREINNYTTLHIYNLNQETEQRIISEGDRVIIEAGYESEGDDKPQQYGKIFDGQVVFPARSKENNTDYVLTLLCVDGANVLGKNFISRSLNRGLNQRQLLQAVCDGGQVKIPVNYVSQGLSSQQLPRGRVVFGECKDHISDIARGNAAGYYVMNGNPAVKLGTMIQIKNSEMNEYVAKPGQVTTPMDEDWIYQAIEVVHTGDTRGNEWYTSVTGISRYGTGSLAALMSNAAQNPNGV